MPQAAAFNEVGSYFGKYFLMKKLAAGGMGEIFVAKQQGPAGFQKVLVVKKILPHLTESKEFIEAFLGEARLAAQMNHRNIVQVFELGEHDGAYFIAMEYVQGKTLRDVVDAALKRKEKIPPELCRTIAEQICDGASYAHNLTDMGGRSLNLVHRDLNPQNVLIAYTGDVKIIDFGIAKSELSTVKTEAGMIKGKFVYMSPEQSLAKKLDKRSDIFSIGISLYEMLTGINPYHKSNIVLTLEAVQRYEPPPPSEYDPAYAPFDPIISSALAKDRDRRYSDAGEMQDDLRRMVLPRPPERLAQFMARLFRTQFEEEQKLLLDSDRRKVTPEAARRTPPKAAQPQPASNTAPIATMPDLSGVESGGTQMLSGPGARARNAPPAPRPAARPQAPVSIPPGEVGDTLVDMDGGPPGRRADDVPGGTAMLKPGQALPPPPRKPMPRREGPVPVSTEEYEAAGGTAILNAAPAQRPAPKKAPLPPKRQASTNIMTPEESEAAQREAQAKMEQAQHAVVRTRTRSDKSAELTQARSSRAMWIALGVGTLAAVALIVGLLFLFFADESGSSSSSRRKAANVPQAQATPVPEPSQEKKSGGEGAQRQIGSGRVLGILTLNPGPNVPVVFGGTELPRQVGAFTLPVTADGGTIEVGEDSALRVTLAYAVSGGTMTVKVRAPARTVATVNGRSAAEARIDKAMTVVEVKRPGGGETMSVRLQYRPK
ncbi:MAG TPA: serine/threonine-protein kinase [Myxococcales bacterium]|nr:serine/threonine-protein kinase [Myxococcales bacterium]